MEAVEFLRVKAMVRSLRWDGDELVDHAGGGRRWKADGTECPTSINFGLPFDQAVVSPSGRFAVVYGERGTKALVLDGARVVRELGRSYYHSADFDYPVTLGRLPDGREVLVHCPDGYSVLEIEDLQSGRRLTSGDRTPTDVFHSRLSVSPDGRHLLVAGWLWSPFGIARVYDLANALADPAVLDGNGLLPLSSGVGAEVAAACWLDGDRIAFATNDEVLDDDEEPSNLGPRQFGVWSISGRQWLHRSSVGYPIGTLLARGTQVVSLYDHPRLIDTGTGAVLAEWPEVKVGPKDGSFGVTHVPTPVAAVSADGTRLAVAQENGIAVIELPVP
ncbi:WD40 repeat domain-containing protein [Streptacidiphilus sp. PAMC 29251]